jgi:hypothetical protein
MIVNEAAKLGLLVGSKIGATGWQSGRAGDIIIN